MEDVLALYEKAYDPKQPLVCFDEGLKQLIEETRPRELLPNQAEENVTIMSTGETVSATCTSFLNP